MTSYVANPNTEKVIINTTLAKIHRTRELLHYAGKHGDDISAYELVEDIAKDSVLGKISISANTAIVPVVAEERDGRNAIPWAYAKWLASHTGAVLDISIFQTVRSFHTGASRLDRFKRQCSFGGVVEYGKHYILVDDHVTMGGTLNGLKRFIEDHGGIVDGITALTASAGGTNFNITEETYKKLKSIDSDGRLEKLLRESYGYEYGFDELTERQGHFLLRGNNRETLLADGGRGGRITGTGANLGEELGTSAQCVEELNRCISQSVKYEKIKKGMVLLLRAKDGYLAVGNHSIAVNQVRGFRDDGIRNVACIESDSIKNVIDLLIQNEYKVAIGSVPIDVRDRPLVTDITNLLSFEDSWNRCIGLNEDGVFKSVDGSSIQVRYIHSNGYLSVEGGEEIAVDISEPFEKALADALHNLNILVDFNHGYKK